MHCLNPKNVHFKGLFEIHVTVAYNSDTNIEKFVSDCKSNKVKPLLIELPEGVERKQLMTSSYHVGDSLSIYKKAIEIARQFVSLGYEILRVKIEATMSTENIPVTDDDAINYYLLVKHINGNDWLKPALFRYGASRLFDSVLQALNEID